LTASASIKVFGAAAENPPGDFPHPGTQGHARTLSWL